MSNIRVELEHDNIRDFLRSADVMALVSGYAKEAAAQLGDGYEADESLQPTRAIASVYADTPEARKKNLENNSILKAVLSNGD